MSDKKEIILTPPQLADIAALPLVADLQFLEVCTSEALNRKMYGVVNAGIRRGFDHAIGDGLKIIVGDDQGKSTACVERNGVLLTVQGQHPVELNFVAGKKQTAVIEAFYEFGVATKQVDVKSSVDAARMLVVDYAAVQPHHVILFDVNIPSSATQITEPMISVARRKSAGLDIESHVEHADPHQQYVKKAGDTLTGELNFIGQGVGVTFSHGDDSSRIFHYGTGASFLNFQVDDDYDEYFRFGAKHWDHDDDESLGEEWFTIKRTSLQFRGHDVYSAYRKPTAEELGVFNARTSYFVLKGDSAGFIRVEFPLSNGMLDEIEIFREYATSINNDENPNFEGDPNWNSGSESHFGALSLNVSSIGRGWGGAVANPTINLSQNYTNLVGKIEIGFNANFCLIVYLRPSANGANYAYRYRNRTVNPSIVIDNEDRITEAEHPYDFKTGAITHTPESDVYIRGDIVQTKKQTDLAYLSPEEGNEFYTQKAEFTGVLEHGHWCRVAALELVNNAVWGNSFYLSLGCTSANFVGNATFLCSYSHNRSSSVFCLNSTYYNAGTPSRLKVRLVVDEGRKCFVEVYGSDRDVDWSTDTINVYISNFLTETKVTEYTTFTNGDVIPEGYTAGREVESSSVIPNYNGYALYGESNDSVLLKRFQSKADLNTLTRSGVYRIEGNNPSTPLGGECGQMLVLHGGADTYAQILCTYNRKKLYWRGWNTSAGAPAWSEIYHTDRKPTHEELGLTVIDFGTF